MDIFVGSIPFKFKEKDLEALFTPFGEVVSVKIIIDKATRQNKGFGFVEMKERKDGLSAIQALNGSDQLGRAIVVSEAKKDKEGEPAFKKPRQWNKGKKKNNVITWG
ncbi:MAG: RNA-binding protein [Leadbetterella sp.]|nr:RNA-binding protein [Leadbetterella sp.]